MIMKVRESGTCLRWKQLEEAFSRRYASVTKQTEISSRLESLTTEEVGGEDEDKHKALEKLTQMRNELAPIARPKDRDDDIKVGFLTKAVQGVEWGLNAQQWIPPEPTFQRLINA